MIALDTNVLVRLFVADDEVQAGRATKLMASEEGVFVSKTVVLEFVWVLAAVYQTRREALIGALTTLAGLENLEIEDRPSVEKAIGLYVNGVDDFADALHVCSSGPSIAFATFDRKLISKARRLGGTLAVRAP